MDDFFSKEPALIKPENLQEWIILNNDNIIAVNKPGGVVCHPSKNGPWSSLVGALKEYMKLETLHLVSRLDRETSGIILIAKHKKSASLHQKAIQNRWVDKEYFAILEGEFSERKEISKALEKDPDSEVHIKQCVSKSYGGKKAQSTFIPLIHRNNYTLAKVKIHTGRKHQIRAHAQWMGHSVCGDKLYGPDESLYLDFCENGWSDKQSKQLPLKRQALHAVSMNFDTPDFTAVYKAALSEDLTQFILDKMELQKEEIEELIDTNFLCSR